MQIWRSRAVGSSEGQVPQGWCHGPLGQVLSKLCVKTNLTQLHLQSSRTSWPLHGPGPAVCCHWLCGAHERSLDISLHPWQPWRCWAYLAELRQGFQPDHVPEGDCNFFFYSQVDTFFVARCARLPELLATLRWPSLWSITLERQLRWLHITYMLPFSWSFCE